MRRFEEKSSWGGERGCVLGCVTELESEAMHLLKLIHYCIRPH